MNYLFENDFNGSGEFFGRPDLVGNPRTGTSTPSNYLNLAAFHVPCTLDVSGNCIPGTQHFGNVGRNVLRGPAQSNIDFSVGKRFPLTELKGIEFRADFFNLPNHANRDNPVSDIGNADFGKVLSFSSSPRIVQFALKFTF